MAWIYVPIGVLCILLACWAVDSLIRLSYVSFPASVALLILLFFGLILGETTLGDKRTKRIVQIIDVPVSLNLLLYGTVQLPDGMQAGFALRYINVFFMPSFGECAASNTIQGSYGTDFNIVTLPLSPPVDGVEVGKIIAVFCEEFPCEGFVIC